MKKTSFKTIFTRAFAALLVALMLIPSLASCDDTTDINDTIIPVYTFYGIKGEGTTDDAIRAVELAINRILISRYSFAVDFRLFLEEEYEEALNAAITEVEDYEEPEDSSEESYASIDDNPYIFTEDKIIKMLEEGKDFELMIPRVDIILCKDSEQYFSLANSKKLVALDTTLVNEGKILSEYIHPTLFSLAKIGRKTFGVPNNIALGEYEYIVFDKEYLDQHKYDYKTIKTLEDLEDYLAIIKENNENVVPLKKAGTPATYEYLFGENSPFYINPTTTAQGEATGRIYGTLDTELYAYIIEDYATLMGKYRSLGFFPEKGDDNKDFAVTFMKGLPSDIEALEKETGKKYEYVVYKDPVATTNSLGALYSISSTVSTTEVNTLIDIIVSIFTDEQIKNYFYHGIQGEHYILDDDDRIQPIKNAETDKFEYVMSNEYTGNIYLADLKQGESPETTEYYKELNLATSLSLTSGFSYVPKTYEVDGVELTEENYVEIMQKVIGDTIQKLSDGSFGKVNYDDFKVTVETDLKKYAEETITTAYSDSLVEAYIAKNAEYLQSDAFLAQIEKEASELVYINLDLNAKNALKIEFTKALKEEMPDATAEEIEAAVNEKITEEAVQEYINNNFTADDIATLISNRKKILINNAKANVSQSYMESAEYKKAIDAYTASSEFKQSVDKYIEDQGDDYVDKKFIQAIEKKITSQVESIQLSAVDAVKKAINEFNEKLKTTYGWSDAELEKNVDVFNYSDFVEKRIEAQYYAVYTDPDAST